MPNRSGRPGTGHINLSDWAAANARGAQSLASGLAGKAETRAQGASAGLDTLNEDFWNDIRRQPRYGEAPTTAAQAQALAAQGYTGPDSLREVSGYEAAMTRAQNAGDGARRLGDFAGRTVALQDLAGVRGGSQYTPGMQAWDSAAAGVAGAQRFQQLGRQWGGLLGRAEGMEVESKGIAKGARDMAQDAQRRYAADAARLGEEERKAAQSGEDAYMRDVSTRMDEAERAEEKQRRRMQPNRPPPAKKEGGGLGMWEGWV